MHDLAALNRLIRCIRYDPVAGPLYRDEVIAAGLAYESLRMALDPVPRERTCKKCGQTKCLTEFGKNVAGRYGKRNECNACLTLYRKCGNDWHLVKATTLQRLGERDK